jgi:ATP-dependent Clp protease ATP-binding subunit ClpA
LKIAGKLIQEINARFAKNTKNVLAIAAKEGKEIKLESFPPEFFILGILFDQNSDCCLFLEQYGLIKEKVKIKIHKINEDISIKNQNYTIYPNRNSKVVLQKALEYGTIFQMNKITPDLLLLVILMKPEKNIIEVLKYFNLDYKLLYIELLKKLNYYNNKVGNYYRSNLKEQINPHIFFNKDN